MTKNILNNVLSIIGIIIAIILTIPLLFICFIFMLTFLQGDTRRVNEVFVSPDGSYQVESINNSAGAMDSSESFLCIEFAEDVKKYSAEEKKPAKKAIELDGIHSTYGADYDIEWTSNKCFTVEWKDWKAEHIVDVEMDGKEYTIVSEQTLEDEKL